ncbi:unnamed protein product [Caenorhabditis bovis]|uniref:protein-histidine N-methyltransferase n=1 Tax=Caenorhabditis bovis TaxID=2654633 RepID=A0A8S1EU54_9PELO|nr:unnamed protein product [Caenorhabditis bovis]
MNVLKLANGREVNYLNEVEVQILMDENGGKTKYADELDGVEASDITTHKYEGGFKIWECTIDLCEYIEENSEFFQGKNVLELGCGAALPSILAAIHGANEVVVQDFNASVIEFFTMPNLASNEHHAKLSSFAIAWDEVAEKVANRHFDVILSSETIYNEADYMHLHNAIAATLAENGVAWIAAKFFYFGVGGSVPSFCDFVNRHGTLTAKEIKVIDASVPRRIVELKRKL